MFNKHKDYINVFLLIFFFGFSLFFLSPKKVEATKFDLIAPSETLKRSKPVTFTINIDTQGAVIKETSIGMTYDTKYLEYVSTTPGDTFSSITTNPQDGGKLVFNASSPDGYNGSGKFADITFNLIAESAGSTELCVLWIPDITPTPAPLTPTVVPPTALPKSGQTIFSQRGLFIGGMFFSLATLFFLLSREAAFKPNSKKHSRHKKK